MKLGQLLGRDAVEKLEERAQRQDEKERKKSRDREINRARRLGKTIRYKRDE